MRLAQILGVISLAIITVAIAACVSPFKKPEKFEAANWDSSVVRGNNEFALDLYKQLAANNPNNLFFSPYSIRTSLAATSAGARGHTDEEIRKTLHLYPEDDRKQLEFLNLQIQRGTGKVTLQVSKRLYVDSSIPLQSSFAESVRKDHIGLKLIDFSKPEDARNGINKLVGNDTHGRIKNLLQPGDITKDTRLVIASAIYFWGLWENKFEASKTTEREFEVRPNAKVRVPMMNGEMTVEYADNDAMQIVKLPYVGQSHSMVLILPKGRMKLPELEARLTEANWNQWMGSCKPKKVEVTLPKLKFGTRYSLKDDLSKLGMPLAFSDGADFSGITTQQKVRISNLIHQANLEVDEQGTIASAGDVGLLMTGSLGDDRFIVDQPAICAIVDNPTGTILFLGRISNPK